MSVAIWSYENLVASEIETSLPTGIIRTILNKITMNESRFTIVEKNVTHGIVQSNLNKISKSNVKVIAEKFADFVAEKEHSMWVVCRFIFSCAKQPLFKDQYAHIVKTMLQRMKSDPLFSALCTHVIKMSIIHLYVRNDINTSTKISKTEYLNYCKAVNIKKRCVGLHAFIATMNNESPEIIDDNFVNECIHSLIETMYALMYNGPSHTYSIFVECILGILDNQKSCNIVYMDEIYETSQNNKVDTRSRFLLLNAIEIYFKKTNQKLPEKYI